VHPTHTLVYQCQPACQNVMKSVNQVWWMQADSHSMQDNTNWRHAEIHNYGRTFIAHGYKSGIDSKCHCFGGVSAEGGGGAEG